MRTSGVRGRIRQDYEKPEYLVDGAIERLYNEPVLRLDGSQSRSNPKLAICGQDRANNTCEFTAPS